MSDYDKRRALADGELDTLAAKKLQISRRKSGNKGFQSARVDPSEIREIETRHKVFEPKKTMKISKKG